MWRGHVAARGLSSEGLRPGRMRFRRRLFAGGQGRARGGRHRPRRGRPGPLGRPQAGRGHAGDAAIHGLYRLAVGGRRCFSAIVEHRRFVAGRRRGRIGPRARRSGSRHQHREGAEQHHEGLNRTHCAQLGAAGPGFKPGRRRGRDLPTAARRCRARDQAASASHPATGRTSTRPAGKRRPRGSRARDAGLWRRRWCRCR